MKRSANNIVALGRERPARKATAVGSLVMCMLCTVPLEGSDVSFAIEGINSVSPDGHKLEGQFGTIRTSKDGESWTEVFCGGLVADEFNHDNNNMLQQLTFGNAIFSASTATQFMTVFSDAENTTSQRYVNEVC